MLTTPSGRSSPAWWCQWRPLCYIRNAASLSLKIRWWSRRPATTSTAIASAAGIAPASDARLTDTRSPGRPVRKRVRMIPAVAVRDFVPSIGGAIAHRAILWDDQMAGAVLGPGASIGVHASPRASFARFGERQDALND